jgi:hypothetical protein
MFVMEIESMAKRIYIAGPMRGIKYYNFPAFDVREFLLKSEGWLVVNPAEIDRQSGFDVGDLPEDHDWSTLPDGFDLKATIGEDLSFLLICSHIYLMKGWESSSGARAEFAVSQWLGLEAIHEEQPKGFQSRDILEEALEITKGDRQAFYGPPDQDFARTAKMWEVILQSCISEGKLEIEPRFVAMCMIALKLSRETHQRKRDNAVDIAGYARCLSLCQ